MEPMEELEFFGSQPTRNAGGIEHTRKLLSLNQAHAKISKNVNKLVHINKPTPPAPTLHKSSNEPKPPLLVVNPPADLASILNKRMRAPPMQLSHKERQQSQERQRRKQQQTMFPQPPSMCPDTTDNLRIRERELKLPTVEQSMLTQNSVGEVASFDEALAYLQQAETPSNDRTSAISGKAQFLHVTPRFNVDHTVINLNFYDLAILEKPGSANSGFVWCRAGVHYRSSVHLGKYDLMQLSAKGLLYSELSDLGDGTVSTFMPISEFLLERELFRKANNMRFFGYFRELKCFTAWRRFVRSKKVKRAAHYLQQHSWFSHEVFVKIYLHIISSCYDVEQTIEICYLSPSGGNLNVIEYIVKQLERIHTVIVPSYTAKVNEIIEFVHRNYLETTSTEHLMGTLAANGIVPGAKPSAAFTGRELARGVDDQQHEYDLMFRRELEFLKQKVFRRMQYLVQLCQHRLNAALCHVMLRFWVRFTELLRGIRRVSVNSSHPVGYWDSNLLDYDVYAYHHHHRHHLHVPEIRPHQHHHHHHYGKEQHDHNEPGHHNYHKFSRETNSSNYQQYMLYSSTDLERDLIELAPDALISHRFVVKCHDPKAVHHEEVIAESHENADGHYNFSVHGSVNVTKLYEDDGVHLSVDVIMSDSSLSTHADLVDPVGDSRGPTGQRMADVFKSVMDVCKMKAILFPSRSQLLKSMDELLVCLFGFLESIPNVLHILLPLMAKGDDGDENADAVEFEFEEEEKINQVRIDNVSQGMATSESSPYFKCLLQIYSLRHSGMIEITVANLKALQDAYKELLLSLDRRQAQLHETYKRLLSLHPTVLATQLNVSLALPKVRTMIELSPAEVDDLQRCEDRDSGRLEALTHALEYLETSKQKVGHWLNIKHHCGIISSFYYCNEQINRFRDLQMTDLYVTLPHAFIKRTKQVIGFMQQMERMFDLSGADLNGIIAMLSKLKNFDTARNSFDKEIDIIKALHNLLHNHLSHCQMTTEVAHQEMLRSKYVGQVVGNQKGVISFSPCNVDHVFVARAYTTSDMLFKQCMNMYATMMSNISKCRLLLGSQLPQIKKEILVDCELLRGTISKCADLLHEFSGLTVGKHPPRSDESSDSAYNPDPTFKYCNQLRTLGPDIDKAKIQAQRLVFMQTMLAEAHDIVGLGSEFFSESDVDNFNSMNKVSIEYRMHSVAWESVLEAKTIQRKLMASKLGSCDCVLYQRRVVVLQQACESILKQQKHLLIVDESKQQTAGNTKPVFIPRGGRKFKTDRSSSVKSSQDMLIASQMLNDIIAQLKPRLESIIYLSFVGLQLHHWKEISDEIFSLCKLKLTIPVGTKEPPIAGVAVQKVGQSQKIELISRSEIMKTITVQDVANKVHVLEMGSLGETPIATLVHRGTIKYNNGVREIVAESVVESLIGQVLEQTEKTLQSAVLMFSSDWLRLGQRGMEIHRVTNIIQLRAMLQYCIKSVTILEDTSSDMGLSLFSVRLYKLMGMLHKMDSFLGDLAVIQYQYQYAHKYLKTAFRGADGMTELDLDSSRLFASVTDDLKTLDSMMSGCRILNFHHVFGNIGSRGLTASENLKGTLITAVETIHSNIQSAYDAFPRLSLLSYTSLNSLMAIWVHPDPSEQMDLLNSYMQQMMEGVGSLVVHKDPAKRKMFCRGFYSHDKTEKVMFVEPILMSVALPDFLVSFESALQILLMDACDVSFTARTQALRSLVQQVMTEEILDSLIDVFKQRWSQLALCLSVNRPNQCFVLSSQCKFAEDVWLCLGHLSGAYLSSMSHANMDAFKLVWRKSLSCLFEVCTVNLDHFRNFLDPTYRLNTIQAIHDTMSTGNIGTNGTRMTTQQQQMVANQSGPTILNSAKEYSLYASLFLQELAHVELIKELQECTALDVAVDLWASRYQLRYIHDKKERVKNSPFDITIGCSTITHRMEYRGGYVKPSNHVRLEHVLHHVISSASYNRGSVFILHDKTAGEAHLADDPSKIGEFLFDAKEEYDVSAQDVAHALGRVLCPIASITSLQCARFFLSRLVFLDAVGCVDFTTIDFAGLQLLSNAMNSMVSSLDKKDEYYLQESLKYPLRGRVTRNDYHTYRRNACVHALREHRMKLMAGNCFKSLIVIGMGSDSLYSDLAVFEHFSRGLFSAVSVNNNQPGVTSLKGMLSVKGYQFAGELHTCFVQSVRNCLDYAVALVGKPGNEAATKIIISNVCKSLVSSRVLCKIVNVAGELLLATLMSTAFRNKQLGLGQLVADYIALSLSTTAGLRGRPLKSPTINREAISLLMDLQLRFQTEVLCFSAVLWENILILLLQAGHRIPSVAPAHTVDRPVRKVTRAVDIPALKKQLCRSFQESLDRLPVAPSNDLTTPAGKQLLEKLKVDLVQSIGSNELNIPNKMQSIIESICISEDVSPDSSFVFQCVALWTMILQTPISLSTQGMLIGMNGSSGSGKTKVREIVLIAMSKTSVRSYALLQETCYCSSVVQKPLRAARIIVKAIGTYTKALKLNRLLQIYKQQTAVMYTAKEFRSRENCVHPRFRESFTSRGANAAGNADGVFDRRNNTRGGFGVSETSLKNVVKKAVAKKIGVKFNRPSTEKSVVEAPKTVHEAQLVEASTIYLNSLTLDTLIGTYDKDGMWKDGLFLRKLRCIEQSVSATVVTPEEANAFHFIVLDGVVGPHLELVFLSSAYQEHNNLFAATSNVNAPKPFLSFPCGEVSRVPSNTIVFIESADLSHASPVLLSVIPLLHIAVTPEAHIKRVIRVWIRNVSQCVSRFSPWVGVVDELCLMLQSELVNTLILSDMATSSDGSSTAGLVNLNIALITSQLSTFLRILEDLLQQCHELALADGTHVEEAVIDSESSDQSESESDSESSGSENETLDVASSAASVDEGMFSSFITSVENVPEGETLPKKTSAGAGINTTRGPMVFVLGSAGREKLMKRVKMSVMYAAIWGFGGIFNSTTRRKFFENLARRAFDEFVSDPLIEGYISLPYDCSMFELYLCLPQMSFVPAGYRRSEQRDMNAVSGIGNNSVYLDAMESFIPGDLQRNAIDIEMSVMSGDCMLSSLVTDILYLNPSQHAVSSAIRSILRSGGNALLFGGHNAGKSFIINALLFELRKNCPSPASMRQDIAQNLQSLICNHNSMSQSKGLSGTNSSSASVGVSENDDGSIPNTFKGVHRVLSGVEQHFKDESFVNDDVTTYADHWIDINSLSEDNDLNVAIGREQGTQYHYLRQSMYSASVSLSAVPSSEKMRNWLKMEFKGEVPESLESPRHSHAIVFIDDVHLAPIREAHEVGQGAVSNRVESLIKGLIAGTPVFGVMTMVRDFLERHSTNGKVNAYIPETSLLMKGAVGMPTMHSTHLSDPRQCSMAVLSPTLMDNCIVQPMGFVAAATGDFDSIVSMSNDSKSLWCGNLPYMCSLSLPSVSLADIHAALIVSSFSCIRQGNLRQADSEAQTIGKNTLVDSLKLNIVELCQFTIGIWSGMYKIIEVPVGAAQATAISSAERLQHMSFSGVERSITAANIPTLTTVTKFCKFLCAGSHSITSKIDLLPLWLHEWHRLFLDPLPVECQQRHRLVGLIQAQLDGLDLDAWGMQSDDIRVLTGKLQGLHSNIWLRTDVLHRGVIPAAGALYHPIELDLAATDINIQTGTWSTENNGFSKHGESSSTVSDAAAVAVRSSDNPNLLLFPQAITLMLRIIRLLTSCSDTKSSNSSSTRNEYEACSSTHSKCPNLVLMGFPGGTRRTAVEMAAKVCNIALMVFEIRENVGVIHEHAGSERRRNFGFKQFLKGVVWKAVGFACFYPPGCATEQEMRVHIESIPPQKVCMMITGVPMMQDADKRLLVSLLAGGSIPVDLFDEAEFAEMIDCLRQALRERNIEAAMALHALNHESSSIHDQMEIKIETADISSPTSRGLGDSLAVPHMVHETITSLQPGLQPPGRREVAGGISGVAAYSLPPLSSQTSSAQNGGSITGYSYHWLKQYVCSHLKSYLSVILDADISRSYLVEPSIDVNGGRSGANNDTAPVNMQKSNNSGNAAAVGSAGSSRRQSRFSMVSSAAIPRRLSVLAVQSTGSGTGSNEISPTRRPSAAISTARRPSTLAPRKDSVNRRRSTVISVSGNVVRLTTDGTPILTNNATMPTVNINTGRNVQDDIYCMASRDYLSFVSCPVLGPLISSSHFDIIWHDVDSYDAATGVCNVLMRNVKLQQASVPILGPAPGHLLSGRTSPQTHQKGSGRSSPVTIYGQPRPVMTMLQASPVQQLKARMDSCRIVLKPCLLRGAVREDCTPTVSSFEINVATTVLGAAQSPYSSLFPYVSWYKSVGIIGSLTLLRENWLIRQAAETKSSPDGGSFSVVSPVKAVPGTPTSTRKTASATPTTVGGPPSPVPSSRYQMGPVSNMPTDILVMEIAAMKEEARSILTHLLTLKIPAIDLMLVSKPLLCFDMERMAMIASEMVMTLLHDGASVILQRQYTLRVALDCLNQSLLTLENAKVMQQSLAANNLQIVKATRKAAAAVSTVQKSFEDFPSIATDHPTYKSMKLLKEEMTAAEELVQKLQDLSGKYCEKFKRQLENFSVEQVSEFSALLSLGQGPSGTRPATSSSSNETSVATASSAVSAPSRYVVMLMRAIMLILNFAVVEKQSGKKKDKDKDASPIVVVSVIDPSVPTTHDDMISKYGAQLASSGEFVQRLCAVTASTVERSGQLASLKYANAVLHTSLPSSEDAETPSAATTGNRPTFFSDNLIEYVTPSILSIKFSADGEAEGEATMTTDNKSQGSMGVVYYCLRDYLQAIEVNCVTQTEIAQMQQLIAELSVKHSAAEEQYNKYYASEELRLKQALVETKDVLRRVDEVGLDNKIKMDQLYRITEDKERLVEQCTSSLNYVESELAEIDAVLMCLVGDICVAAAVFARTSSFREQIRQECMDTFRAELRLRLGMDRVSDSPYVLGCLVDRLQIRHWTNGHFESLSRDPATVNATSLLYLSPVFTYVFDPEQVCEDVLSDLLPVHRLDSYKSEYEVYSTSAQSFSLAHLETWIDATMASHQTMDIAVTILITDAQTGASDDLVHLLAADLSVCRNGQPVMRSGAMGAADLSVNAQQSHTTDHSGLNRGGREKPCICVDMSNGVDGASHVFSSSKSATLLLTNKLRVILLSSTLPTLDPLTNTCSPIPLCCFKNMSVVHWSASCSNVTDWYSESKPFASHALNNNFTADFTFEAKLVETLCAKLAPDLYSQLYIYNKMVIETTNEIYQLENNLVYALENWNMHGWHAAEEVASSRGCSPQQHNDDLQSKLGYSLVPVYFGFIAEPYCVRILNDSCVAKHQLQIEVEAWKSFEREIYSYQACVGGLFSMSLDLIRMVSIIVPSYHLTPCCLTAKTICSKGIAPLIQKAVPMRQSDPTDSNTSAKTQKLKSSAGITENERNLLFAMQKIPPSLIGMSRLSKAVVRLQTTFRVKTGRVRPSGRDISRQRVHQEATNALINIKLTRMLSTDKSHVARSVSASIKSRYLVRFGFDEFTRKQLMLDLNVLLLPLKLPLFYSIVEFLINNVVPGYEYLVKFCVLLTTLMQPHSNGGSSTETRGLPLEEVRALIEIWRSSNAGVYNSDKLFYCNFYRIRKSGVNQTARHSSSARSRSVSEKEENDDFVATEVLAGMAGSNRLGLTAYRPKFVRPRSSSHTTGGFRALVETSWRGIGPGHLDGVWISRKSTKWRIKSIPQNSSGLIMASEQAHILSQKTAGFATVHSDVICCDMLAPDLIVKNRNMTARPYDSFMAEWLEILHGVKACSIHSYSSQSITSLASVGIGGSKDSNAVQEEISLRSLYQELQRRRARLSTVIPVGNLVDSARSSNFEAHPPASVGMPQRPSILKRAAFKPKKKDAIDEGSDSESSSSDDSDQSEDHSQRVKEKLAELKKTLASSALSQSNTGNEVSYITRATRCSMVVTSGMATSDPRRHSILKTPLPNRRDSLLSAPVVAVATSRLSVMMNGVGGTSSRRMSSFAGVNDGDGSIALANEKLRLLNSMKGSAQEELDEEILPQVPRFKQLCTLLENHRSLGRVFAGLTSIIFVKYDDEILEWKRALMATSDLDVQALSSQELYEHVIQLIPPIIDERDESEMSGSTTDIDSHGAEGEGSQERLPAPARGLWMLGKELSILQTIILASVLAPGSVGKLIDIYLAMVTVYLQHDGILVGHPDELNVAEKEEDSDNEVMETLDGSSSSEEDEEGEHGNAFCKGVMPAHSLSTGGNGPSKRKHQDGIMVVNSWSKLSNILGERTLARQARFSTKTSRYKLTCREYENWESILLDILTCFPVTPIDKYTYMHSLRDAVSGVSTNVFLSSPTARNALSSAQSDESGGRAQLILLSQRAKELSQYSSKNVPLFNSKLYESNDGTVSDSARLVEFVAAVKSAVLSSVQQRAIIQDIALNSSAGNTLIAAILNAVHASTNHLSIGTNSGPSIKGVNAKVKPRQDAHKDIAESIEKALLRKEVTRNSITKSYPLIISSHWQEEHMRSGFFFQATNTVDNRNRSMRQYSRLSSAPFNFLGTMSFSWLPRFRCVDIISTSDSSFESPPEHRLSINESCGALYEELEGSLIWVINSFRLLTKTNLTSRIKNRFKFANKLESRLTSALITIYRLCLYIECKEREEEKMMELQQEQTEGGHGGTAAGSTDTLSTFSIEWSKCVEPVSLWQLSRLMLHATDIVNDAEKFVENLGGQNDDPARTDVLNSDEFRHGVALCSASFLEFLAGHVGLEESIGKQIHPKGSKHGKPVRKHKKYFDHNTAIPAMKTKSASAAVRSSNRASIRTVMQVASPEFGRSTSPRPPDSAFRPSSAVASRPNTVPDAPPGSPSGKMQETVTAIIARNISSLSAMRHVDSLRATDTEASITDTGLTIRNSVRLHSMVGLLLAEITQKVLSDGITNDARQSFLHGKKESKYSRHSMTSTEQNRHSIAVGVSTAREESFAPKEGTGRELLCRNTISIDHCNITVGGLSELETLNCIVRWTLDGMYNSNDTPTVATTTVTSTGVLSESSEAAAPYVAPRMTKQRRKYILDILRKYILKQAGGSASSGGSSAVATMMSNIIQDQGNARVLPI